MNAKQIARRTGNIASTASEIIAYNHYSVAFFRLLIGAAASVFSFLLYQNWNDVTSAAKQVPVIAAQVSINTQELARMPDRIAAARPDPFTGTEGRLLERRIDRLENRVYGLPAHE